MKNKEIVKKMYSLQNAGNFKEFKALLAPGYKLVSPFSPLEILRIQNEKVTEDYVEMNLSVLLEQIGVTAEKARIVA